jgi:DNA polymerase I-like protein with 3'-5' exonuclease and polymerase domains/uracil-DNA glycosylase
MAFFPDLPDEPLKAEPIRQQRKAASKTINTGERGCDACPLKASWPQLTSPRMQMTGNLERGDILLLGGVPEEKDDKEGKQFEGPAGKHILKAISGNNRQRLVYSHLQRCHSITGHTRVVHQVSHACSIHLEDDLDRMGIKAIIGVGTDALQRYFPGAQIREVYGMHFAVEINKRLYWYLPTFDTHPLLDTAKYPNPDYAAFYNLMKADLKTFFNVIDSLPKPEIAQISTKDVIIPKSEKEAYQLIDEMDDQPLGVDLEATCLLPYTHKARILTGSFSDGKTTIAFNIGHSQGVTRWGQRFLFDILSQRQWIAHFSSMELKWFRYFGGPDADIQAFHDSAALARLHHERKYALNLGEVGRIHLGVNVKTLSNLETTRLDEYPLEEVLGYNGLDAWAARRIYDKLIDRVNPRNYQRLIDSVNTCVGMELMGLPTDQAAAKILHKEWNGKVEKAEAKVRNLYEVKQFELTTQKEFDLGSTKQLGLILTKFAKINLPKTDADNYKTDEATLKELATDHPLVSSILEVREASKQISTYITPIVESQLIYPDKLLHPSYGVYNTNTLRLSSENPNAQNFPKRRHRQIRKMIRALKGHVIVPIDFAQLEARILAMVSKDRAFCQAIIDGFDIHSFWLNQVLEMCPEYWDRLEQKTNSTDEKKVRKGGRDVIKTDFVFASFYGSSAKACAYKTGVPFDVMEALAIKFWRTYDGVRTWQKEQRAIYTATGSVYTITGRARHDICPGNEVINNPIQGVAADVVADAMNELAYLSRKEKDPYLHPRMQIHDDLTFILPDQDSLLEEYLLRICEVMVAVKNKWQIVPFAVEASIGDNWCDTSELMTYVGDYNKR